MYRLQHANSVPIRASALRVGLPIYEHTIPNIAIVSRNNTDPVHLNAQVLRQALLNSPEEVAQLLGLRVIDLTNKPVSKQPTKEPKKEIKKETKPKTSSKESKEVDEWV
jgi:hypothetical protein